MLAGDGLRLRRATSDDAAFRAQLCNDPRVRAGISIAVPRTAGDVREYHEDGDDVFFVVEAEGERVGVLDLVDVDHRAGNAEVGYFFAPDHWGNGYATAALERGVTFAFEELRLHKLYARAFAFNAASRRVLEKAGFSLEGTFSEHAYADGEYVDVHRFGLLEREWRRA